MMVLSQSFLSSFRARLLKIRKLGPKTVAWSILFHVKRESFAFLISGDHYTNLLEELLVSGYELNIAEQDQ